VPLEFTDVEQQAVVLRLREFVTEAGLDPATPGIEFAARQGPDVRRAILGQIDAAGGDLLVIGSHGRTGLQRLLLGSVAEKLLRSADCPVMVVPHGLPGAARPEVRFARILCPVDFSTASGHALTYAFALAQETAAHLTLLHSIEVPPELRARLATLRELNIDQLHAEAEADALLRLRALVPASVRQSCTVETIATEGAAYRQILTTADAQASDLIVMGVTGRGALDLAVFGSNTARVIQHAQCPVLVVHP
jgi:nucleotide-binding universal stress UspA family protein